MVKKIFIILLTILAALSSAYILMLGYYNCLTMDDYGYIFQFETMGPWEALKLAYNGWQGRFSTFLMNDVVYWIFGRADNLIGATITMLLIGYVVTKSLLSGILHKVSIDMPQYIQWIFIVLVVNLGIMSYLVPSTFYWFCALNYTFCSWMAILLTYALFFSTRQNWIRWLEVVFASWYISGCSENFPPLVIMTLGIIWLIRIITGVKQQEGKQVFRQNSMLFVSLAILCVGFVILLLAPGNANRRADFNSDMDAQQQMTLLSWGITTIKASVIFGIRLLSRSLYYVAIIPISLALGMLFGREENRVSMKNTVWVIVGVVALLVIDIAACVYGTGWYAPLRSFSFVAILIAMVVAYLSFLWGEKINKDIHKVFVWVCSLISTICLIGTLVCFISHDQKLAEMYHHDIYSRNHIIQVEAQKGRKEPLVVSQYSYPWSLSTYAIMRNGISKMLGKQSQLEESEPLFFPSLLEEDSKDWTNRGVHEYYHTEFDIICKHVDR